jgi:succinate dehydrogenase / fumarate reductase flavoprotein subunit
MQGLADGYFVVPATIAAHLAGRKLSAVGSEHAAFAEAEAVARERIGRILAVQGRRSADSIHRELGQLMWNQCGMARERAGLGQALERIRALRAEFWENVRVPGDARDFNQTLEHAGRVADFLEFAELLALDAREREESCGGHFRVEHQTPDGEARRDDERFAHVAAWEFQGQGSEPRLHKEPLTFEVVHPSTRSYK